MLLPHSAITPDFCWADDRTARAATAGRPALFLDRDGVLIEDTGYPHHAAQVVLVPEALVLVGAANRAGFAVGIVSNQSGIGRGLFDWEAFAAVQAVIDAALAGQAAHLDFVRACPHHPEAVVPRCRHSAHPWRKPRPGMVLDATKILALDLGRSVLVGDRASDMAAATAAGVPHRLWLDGPAGAAGAEAVGRGGLVAAFRRIAAGGL